MTLKKVPIAATSVHFKEVLSSMGALFEKVKFQEQLKAQFSPFIGKKYLFFLNSGLTSGFVILKALKNISQKKEVILPAYTASSLIVAIKKAGLRPVLCDISLDDFNMDIAMVGDLVSQNTLAILEVHMFGIVAKDLDNLGNRLSDIFIVEDCAQGLGGKLNGKPVGNLEDLSFFSFNKGKNLPTYGGGCIATNNEEIAKEINNQGLRVKDLGLLDKVLIPLKIVALSLAARPYIYGMLYFFISFFKEQVLPGDFEVKKYTDFQAAVALSLLRRMEEFSKKRYYNGMKLIEGLKGVREVILPKISEDTQPAFNRLPVVFKDLKRREKVEESLWRVGIETSRLYYKPLHHIFDLGYKKSDFPNAVYFAEHLLTLPVHPLVTNTDLEKIIEVIRGVGKG